MHFTYEYSHSSLGGVAVHRLLFNLVFFQRHFHFWTWHIYTLPYLEATCPFFGLSSSGSPGSKGLIYFTIFYTLRWLPKTRWLLILGLGGRPGTLWRRGGPRKKLLWKPQDPAACTSTACVRGGASLELEEVR